MLQYVLNFGQIGVLDESVPTGAIDALVPLVRAGNGVLPGFSPFRAEIIVLNDGGALFAIWRGREPLLASGLAWTKREAVNLWPAMEDNYVEERERDPAFYEQAKPLEKPVSLPWLAVTVNRLILNTTKEDITRLLHANRCLALAIMREAGARA